MLEDGVCHLGVRVLKLLEVELVILFTGFLATNVLLMPYFCLGTEVVLSIVRGVIEIGVWLASNRIVIAIVRGSLFEYCS